MAHKAPESRAKSYVDVADAIREQLRTGQFSPGTLLPTERELQDVFRVSRTTVRRAISTLVSSGWAESIANRGVVGRLGRVQPASNIVGLVDHGHDLHQSFFFLLSAKLEEHGLHLAHVDSHHRGVESALETCLDRGFCAAVVWSKTATPDVDRVQRVADQIPIVAVDHGLRGVDLPLVRHDVYNGAREAVRYLAAQGRKRIALSGMMDAIDTTFDRFGGYMAGKFEVGQQPDVMDFLFVTTSNMASPNPRLLASRLRDTDRPDAILVMQDYAIQGVINAIQASGLSVPDEIAVVGMGNDVPLTINNLALTTVAFDWQALASRLAQQLSESVRGVRSRPEPITISTHLIIRGTCGAPRDQWQTEPFMPNRLMPIPVAPLPA